MIAEGIGYVQYLFRCIIDGMKTPLHVWSYDFSLWEVFVYTIIVILVAKLIGGILNG